MIKMIEIMEIIMFDASLNYRLIYHVDSLVESREKER